jgi:glycosyltransferase involved in cell wall biosynthesis
MDIIYFKTSNSSFVLTDKRILEKSFDVTTYHINNKNGFYYVFSLLKLFLFLLFKGWRAKVYFIRFADWHTALLALFCKFYNKKLVIVVGGFDAFHLPEYGYGVYHNKFRGLCARYALRNANAILPNSPCLIENINTYAAAEPIRGGIRYFEPRIKGRIVVVYNGFDLTYWANVQRVEKKDVIITVAIVNNLRTFYLKGVDSFIELARQMSGRKFKIIGLNKTFLKRNKINIPSNLEVIDFLEHRELLRHYLEARVFCLFSLTEGMSNVLCEAMLCECIPVGSNVTFIPEIIGDTGFIVKHKNIEEIKQKVEEALRSRPQLGKMAKQRIIDNYSLESRENALTAIIEGML